MPSLPSSLPISAVILTYNEELNIQRALANVHGWAREILIIDSFSTDATLDICRPYTNKIHQHAFENQAKQFNWALDHVSITQPWVLRLDADEVVPDELKGEIAQLVASVPPEVTGIYLNRRTFFMNRWLKHGGLHPHYILRVFRTGAGRFEEKTEEHLVLGRGRAIYAKNPFIEDNRQNTLKYWLRKHDDLSDGEIRDTLLETFSQKSDLKATLFGNKAQRMRWWKVHVYTRLPLFVRPLVYFTYRYFLRLGFLDGVPGLIFHVLQAFWYRFYIDARIYEARSNWQAGAARHDRVSANGVGDHAPTLSPVDKVR